MRTAFAIVLSVAQKNPPHETKPNKPNQSQRKTVLTERKRGNGTVWHACRATEQSQCQCINRLVSPPSMVTFTPVMKPA